MEQQDDSKYCVLVGQNSLCVEDLGVALKVATGGEDALFVSGCNGGIIGVADGVGGWRDSGINPAGKTC